MKKIQNHIKKLFRLSISTIVGVTLLLTPFGVARAQTPGVNGRILWAAPSTHYSIFADGTDIKDTNIPSTVSSNKWAAVYNPAGTDIYYPNQCTSGTLSNVGMFSVTNALTPAGTQITCPSGSGTRSMQEPAVYNDGSKIAFAVYTTNNGGEREVHVMNADGSNNITLTNQINGTNSQNPVWGPGGAHVYIANQNNIRRVDASTPNQVTALDVTTDASTQDLVCRLNDIHPNDGKTLLYTSNDQFNCNSKVSGQGDQLMTTTRTPGGVATAITNDNNDYIGGYYSPDGTQIVAVRFNPSNNLTELVTMDADGSNIQLVANVPAADGGPGVLNSGALSSYSYRPFWSTDQTSFITAPTCTLTATPSTIASGGSSSIGWTTTDGTTLTLDNGIGEVNPVASGSTSVSPVVTTTYSGTVEGPGGTADCNAVTVTVTDTPAPTCTLTATPSTIGAGGSSALGWTTTDATDVTIDTVTAGTDVSVNPVASGSVTVTPAATRVYTCKVTGPGGEGSSTTTITVNDTPASPSCTLTADPASITSGESSFLTWTSTNATSMSINQDIGTVTPVGGGEVEVAPTATTTYTATVTGSGQTTGGCSATVTIPTTPGGGSLANAGGNLASGGLAGLLILGSVYALNSEEIRRRLRKAAKKA